MAVSSFLKILKEFDKDNIEGNNNTLQYLYQIFISDFAFIKKVKDNNHKRNEFLRALVDVCADDNNNIIPLSLNKFSKFVTLSKILDLTRSNYEEMKQEHKDNEDNIEIEDARNRLSTKIDDITQHDDMDQVLLPLYILSAEENYMHHKHKDENKGNMLHKPSKKTIELVVKKFNDSFDKTKLDQLLAIADVKLHIYYICVYISKILSRKGKFKKDGLIYKKKIAINNKYLQTLGTLFKILNNTSNSKKCIQRGLQYFMISSLWNSPLGPSRTMLCSKLNIFTNTLNINMKSIMNEMAPEIKENDDDEKELQAENIPKDNPFLLMINKNEKTDINMIVDIEKSFKQKKEINYKNNIKYAVFITSVLFNMGYLR
eukprot:174500_1